MNYTATKNASGTYDIFQNGSKVSTGTASTLGSYGLSETNLGAASAAPSAAPAAPAAPAPAPTNTNTSIPDTYYSNYAAGVGSGALTADQAMTDLKAQFPGVNIDTSKLFPTGQNYTTGAGQKVQFDATGKGSVIPTPGSTPATTPTAPGMTNIPPTINPPSNGGSYTPPAGNGATAADQFNTSLASTVATLQKQLADGLATQTKAYQDKIDALTQQKQDADQLSEAGLLGENSTVAKESADKQAAIEQEQQQFTQNYNARQALVGRLQTLLESGQSIIEGMKTTTGLASIMNPRLTQTMSDIQAEAGVITATLSAYSDQIGLAQSQLKTSTDAITSLYSDQVNYYKSVVDFYSSKSSAIEGEITDLTKDQKSYIDEAMSVLEDKIKTTQAAQQAIQTAMLNPDTALAYAKAGITLNDTPAQMNAKLATYEQAQQNAWSAPTLLGGDYIQTNKLTGETRTVVSNTAGGAGGGTGGAVNNSKGTMASKQYVEISLQRAGITYDAALAKVPKGKVGVVDNASGQIGYIDPTEYNTKQYTYL